MDYTHLNFKGLRYTTVYDCDGSVVDIRYSYDDIVSQNLKFIVDLFNKKKYLEALRICSIECLLDNSNAYYMKGLIFIILNKDKEEYKQLFEKAVEIDNNLFAERKLKEI